MDQRVTIGDIAAVVGRGTGGHENKLRRQITRAAFFKLYPDRVCVLQCGISPNGLDLVPLAANARQSIERAIADFRKNADGVNVEAAVTGVRLAGVEFDAKTLRVVAEADGTVRVTVTKLATK